MPKPAFRGTFAAVLMLAAAAFAPVAAQPQETAKPAQIDKNGTLILIRSTLIALQHANETGNYTVLRELGAPGFQQANNAVRLGEIFASLRAQRLDLSGVAVLEPQLTLLPQIEPNGLMHLAGFFPSVPTQVNFELLYAPVDGRWRLFGISVKLGSSTPVAPSAPPPASAPPSSTAPPPASAAATASVPAKKKPEPAKAKRKTAPKPKASDEGAGEP